MINWRVDGTVMRFRMTSEMREKRIFAVFPGSVVALHKPYTPPMRPFPLRSYNDLRILAKARFRRLAHLAIPAGAAKTRAVLSAGRKGDALVRPAILAAMVAALAACSSATPPPPSDPQASAAIVKKDCSDPKWQEENLGLWYSVCRQPLRW